MKRFVPSVVALFDQLTMIKTAVDDAVGLTVESWVPKDHGLFVFHLAQSKTTHRYLGKLP